MRPNPFGSRPKCTVVKGLKYKLRSHPRAIDELYTDFYWLNPEPGPSPFKEGGGYKTWKLEPHKRYWLFRLWSFRDNKRVTVRLVMTQWRAMRVYPWGTDNIRIQMQMRICDFLGMDWLEWRRQQAMRDAIKIKPGTGFFDPFTGIGFHRLNAQN